MDTDPTLTKKMIKNVIGFEEANFGATLTPKVKVISDAIISS